RVSRFGVIAFASSLDQVGPFAQDVRGVAYLLGAVAGHDNDDQTSSPRPVPDYAAGLDRGVRGLRIGVPRECFGEGLAAEVERRIMLGTYALSAGYYDAYYLRAQKVRALIRRDFDQAFATVDAVLSPTSPTTAFKLGEKLDDPLAMYLNDVYTVPANLAGLPGISVPCGFDSRKLPVGLQLIGRPFDDETLPRIA